MKHNRLRTLSVAQRWSADRNENNVQPRRTILKLLDVRIYDGYHIYLIHDTYHVFVCTCDMVCKSSCAGMWYLASYDQICKSLVPHEEERNRNTIGWRVSVACVCWTYWCTGVVVVRLRAPATDSICVAGAVLLACYWRCQYVVVTATILRWRSRRDRTLDCFQLHTVDGINLPGIRFWQMDRIISTDTSGRDFVFCGTVEGVNRSWIFFKWRSRRTMW